LAAFGQPPPFREGCPVSLIACKSCGAKLALPDGLAGDLCKCSRCGALFAAPVPAAATPAATAPVPGAATLLTTALPAAAGRVRAHPVADETSAPGAKPTPEKRIVWTDLLCWQLAGMCAGLLGVFIALRGQKMDALLRGIALLLLTAGVLVGGGWRPRSTACSGPAGSRTGSARAASR
jgi:hypothetical protein